MNPPPGVMLLDCPDAPSAPKAQAAPAPHAAVADTVLVQVDEFIWKDMDRPADAAEPAPQEVAEETEAPLDGTEPPRIVVLSDDESSEPEDGWRRQLISALQDVDREAGPLTPLPAVPPARTYIEDLQRPPPRSLSSTRSARVCTPAPIVRTPRHRMAPVLLSISAAAGLLTITVPRTANMPDTSMAATASEAIITGSLVPAAGDDTLKPIIMNSPVLVREGMSRRHQTALPVGPVIETVRTVPVPLHREAAVSEPSVQSTPAVNLPVVEAPPAADPTPTPAAAEPPPPAAASAPLDRDALAALTAPPPAAPPPTVPPLPQAKASQAPSAPVAAASPEPEKPSPPATRPTPKRKPQISSSYERSAPKTSRESRKRKARTSKTTTARAESKKWDTRRQGLRTSGSTEVKEVEPSTMVKLLKSLNPFASKGESQDRPKKNIFE